MISHKFGEALGYGRVFLGGADAQRFELLGLEANAYYEAALMRLLLHWATQ